MIEEEIAQIASHISKVECGVISAFTGPDYARNEEMHEKLRQDLIDLGYSPIEAMGGWNKSVEKCWIVPGIPVKDLLDMAKKYGQEAVLKVDGTRSEILWTGFGQGASRRSPNSSKTSSHSVIRRKLPASRRL